MSNYVLNIMDAISIYEKKCCPKVYISKFNINFKKQKFKNIADIYNINKALTFIAFKKEIGFANFYLKFN